jgi:hypothetical protein
VVPPGAHVDVEQLVLAVSTVELVFELDESVEVDRAEEPHGELLQKRLLDRLDVRTCPPKIWRVLASPTGDHAPN